MKTEIFTFQASVPTIDEFAARFPAYAQLAKGQGRFLFDLILSAESFAAMKVVSLELKLPAIAAVARRINDSVQKRGAELSLRESQFCGVCVLALMEANGFKKTGRKKAVPIEGFLRAEVYEEK